MRLRLALALPLALVAGACGAKGPPMAPGADAPPARFLETDEGLLTRPQPGLEAGAGYGGAGGEPAGDPSPADGGGGAADERPAGQQGTR